MAKQKIRSLKSQSTTKFVVSLCLFILFLGALATLIVSLLLWKNMWLEIGLGGAALVLAIVIFVLNIVLSSQMHRVFYKSFYEKNLNNLKAIEKHSYETEVINGEYKEFKDINKVYNNIKKQTKGQAVKVNDFDYDSIPLEYVNKVESLVTFESLQNNIVDLIAVTKSYRAALVDISYDIEEKTIEEAKFKQLLDATKEKLDYEHLLFAMNKTKNGLLVFIPIFDGVHQLEEELTSLLREISVIKRTAEGRKLMGATIAAVVYPYSSPENIFNDLVFAKRSERTINIYMPYKDISENDRMLFENVTFNEVTKQNERIDEITGSYADINREVGRVLQNLLNYFSFTCTGYAKYNRVKKQFTCDFSCSSDNSHLVDQGLELSADFVNSLVTVLDKDHTYYFSSRKHVNDCVAPFIDAHKVKSGLFYVAMKGNTPECVVYLLNDDKNMSYDFATKQTLILLLQKIGNFLKYNDEQHIADLNTKRFQEILKLNNDLLYSVNPDDYSLFFISAALKFIAPDAEEGQTCYKALYGLDKPCKACPLKTKKHMVEILRRRKFETSVVLHNAEDKAEHLYLKPMEKRKGTSDLFTPDFLVNSYYAFCMYLDDEFALQHAGEVIFMNINNVEDLIKSLGNDGYIKAVRSFFDAIKEQIDLNLTIYLYKNDNFALVLPEHDRETIISLVETLYTCSKNIAVEDKTTDLNISYYDFKYPAEDTESKIWVNHAERVMTGLRRGKNDDTLYFNEDKYTRSASRETFMLNNVIEAFKRKKYYTDYQPIVGNRDRTIHGVELLLRLNDPFTDGQINIGEAINIVTKNGRIDLVSKAMKECVDKLFEKSDIPFFRTVGLEHISVNAEYTTLADKSFINSFADLVKKYNVPKNFFRIEVQESDISENYDKYRELKIDFMELVCDQYHGELLRIDQLKDVGIKEVKIARDVISNIVNDDVALSKATAIWKEATSLGMETTFVGVEKRQQADLLHDDALDSGFQGRFFYSPMNEEQFFKTLRETSIKEIADLDN